MYNNQKIKIINGWRFYNLPVQYSEADYQEARNELVNKAKKTPGLIALFEYGYIPFLGISDMDFWAVFADDAKTMQIPSEPILSKKTRDVMFHKMTVITEKHYRQMLYLDPWTTNIWPDGHSLLYQKENIKRDLNFKKIDFNSEEKNILGISFIDEFLGTIYSNISYYAQKKLPVRAVFETLKSCIYVMREVNLIADKKINNSFTEEFNDLRTNWFKLEQKKAFRRLINISYRGLLIGFESAFLLSDWLNKRCQLISTQDLGIRNTNFYNHSFLDKNFKNIYLNTFKDRQIFTNLVKTPEEALKLSINSYAEIKINFGWRTKIIDFYIVFQPLGMASLPLALISENGLLSDNLRNDIYTNQKQVPIFKPKALQDKIRMINEITEIYNKKQRPNSDGKGFLSGNHRYGYLFEKEKLRRKLLTLYIKRKFWKTINKL